MFGLIVNKHVRHFSTVVLCAAFCLLEAGCQLGPRHGRVASITTPEELKAAQAQAANRNRPLTVLVTDTGNGAADNDARAALASRGVVQTTHGNVVIASLDLSISRARATASRFHPLETPLLVCLSPQGMIVSRDTAPITEGLILERMQQALMQSPELDVKLGQLQKVADDKNDAAAQMQLADFLMERKNALEAIPVLAAVAHSNAADSSLRICAWAELVRAHFWIGEAEKGRFEAQDLMAALGPSAPEARAAANLVLGNQDATNPKRFPRARQEFEAAIAAAPGSAYGKQAAAALTDLPKGDSGQ